MSHVNNLKEKYQEALASVLPIVLIVLAICAVYLPMETGVVLTFLAGSVLLIIGMTLFTLGAEMSISPLGKYVGSYMTKSRRLWVILTLSFLLGFVITISEPDLQVLANQVPTISNYALILSVAAGVGAFLVVGLLRMLFRIPLPPLLIGMYALIFLLTVFVPENFLAVAFDAGGVTTGPMTVPFIMSLGVGVSLIRSDRHAANDSFGLVAICSIGPILAVLALGMIYHTNEATVTLSTVPEISDSRELFRMFCTELPTYMKEIAVSMLPILLFAVGFQIAAMRLSTHRLQRLGVGLVYTYVGLVLFLTGANVGFMPAGNLLGEMIASQRHHWVIVPVGMLMGYFIVKAEPAVYVLNRQVEQMTNGGISEGAMGRALSIGVALSVGIAMIRVLTGVSILWFLIPGYAIALLVSYFVPKMYTAIAFDSGGVASGPMTAAFLVPLAQGACTAVGGNLVTDAFGIVAMVAMTPLITIQMMGLISEYRRRKYWKRRAVLDLEFEQLDDDEIILL